MTGICHTCLAVRPAASLEYHAPGSARCRAVAGCRRRWLRALGRRR